MCSGYHFRLIPVASTLVGWLDRDTNACLKFQRIGESMQRPLELCSWKDREALPPVGKEYQQGYKRVTAVSNSSTQREFILSQAAVRGLRNLQVITANVVDFKAPGTYDRIVSIEMFEHMKNYQELLRRCASWLVEDGRLFVHIFVHKSLPYHFETKGPADWMSRYFFTGGSGPGRAEDEMEVAPPRVPLPVLLLAPLSLTQLVVGRWVGWLLALQPASADPQQLLLGAGGTMPSMDLLLYFQDHLALQSHWYVNGCHYSRTLEAWLERHDAARSAILRSFSKPQAYGSSAAAWTWYQRWRMFYIACSELFRYNGGEEWGVGHYLFTKKK
ncbi:hypothetical protein QJQ45_011630 [Haematococcus lacustris]|nr:hypothetical protein QJQ45_011630 [Haematococcus lacustris]